MKYKMEIAGVQRELSLYSVNENLYIAAFIIMGDVEVTVRSAAELLKAAPDFDVIFTGEAKSIPLAHEMARQSGRPYVVARKGVKVYMADVISSDTKSITTANHQILHLGGDDVALLRGRRVLIVDDVISTGGSLNSLEHLASKAGATIIAKMAILAEGDAAKRDDIFFLEPLPLFDAQGNPLS